MKVFSKKWLTTMMAYIIIRIKLMKREKQQQRGKAAVRACPRLRGIAVTILITMAFASIAALAFRVFGFKPNVLAAQAAWLSAVGLVSWNKSKGAEK